MKKKDLIAIRGRRCECCKRSKWLGKPIPLEIHHVNPPSECLDDLQLLCPNCHALTPNYRGRGIRTAKSVTDRELIDAVAKSDNVRQLLVNLGLVAKGGNYDVIRKRLVALDLSQKFAKHSQDKVCHQCGFTFVSNEDIKFCSNSCANKYNAQANPQQTKIQWPEISVLKRMVETKGYSKTGRELGVSDNAVRKRLSRQLADHSGLKLEML